MIQPLKTTAFFLLVASLLLPGCGGGESEATGADAGGDISGGIIELQDAGSGAVDGAEVDALDMSGGEDSSDPDAQAPDAQAPDAQVPMDGSVEDLLDPEDTTVPDAGPMSSELAIDCDDSSQSIYVTPSSALEPDVALGAVSTCTSDNTWSVSWMNNSLSAVGQEANYGIQELRISYRTERSSGAPGASTAFILLPEPRPAEPMPTIVWAHGTAGLADGCAPTNYPGYYGYLPYTFAAQGYAVIGPDYAGLGNEGIQGYGDARDTAYSLLDAPAALGAVLGPNRLSGEVIMIGHSQGGGAVLYAQALEKEHPVEGELMGVIDIAGDIVTDDVLSPNQWTYWNLVPANYAQGTSASFLVLYVFAHLANTWGEEEADSFFGPEWKETVTGWIETQCIFDLIQSFNSLAPTVMFDDIFDPSFPAGVLACIEEDPLCQEPYATYVSTLKAHLHPSDPEGARVAIFAGMLDTLTTPEELACTVDTMAQWGVVADLCVHPLATHSSIVEGGIGDALAWTEAVLKGEAAPPCSKNGALPLCP